MSVSAVIVYVCSDVSGYRIVGSPRCIDDKKYARNAFIFNFVFVFASSTTTAAYEPIITKIGDTFRTCEVRINIKLSQPFTIMYMKGFQ